MPSCIGAKAIWLLPCRLQESAAVQGVGPNCILTSLDSRALPCRWMGEICCAALRRRIAFFKLPSCVDCTGYLTDMCAASSQSRSVCLFGLAGLGSWSNPTCTCQSCDGSRWSVVHGSRGEPGGTAHLHTGEYHHDFLCYSESHLGDLDGA
jgi:hypothetical protein